MIQHIIVPALGVRSICLLIIASLCLPATASTLKSADWESMARRLADERIGYSQKWTPPGESSAWAMDCSNTVRWLYREGTGVLLPRTCSAQYEYFSKTGRLRRVRPDPNRLMRELKRGDLLFWEHTYRPARKPPVTHVMMYLGRDHRGRMWMAGSQGSRGVSVYEFKPRQRFGGYPWFLWFRREGRFVAYARP